MGALNLSVRGYGPLTSFPVSDRSVTRGEYEGPKAPYRRLLFSLVAWQQNGRIVRSGRSYLSSLSLGAGGGECSLLDLIPMSFLFIIVPIPFLVGPFVLSRIPCFVPKRRSQRGVVVSRAYATLALFPQTWPFIGPTRLN